MATLRDIQRRIKAVKGTQQITKAMKMVSASKLRKVQGRMLNLRPYSDRMREVIASLAVAGCNQEAHPLLEQRPVKVVEVLAITSDRGLCGAFNTNVMRMTTRIKREFEQDERDTVSGGSVQVDMATVGKKGRDYFRYRNIEAQQSWIGISGNLEYVHAQAIARYFMDRFLEGQVDEVHIVYNHFRNAAQQEVSTMQLLPASPVTCGEDSNVQVTTNPSDFIYEPSEEAILDDLVPKNVEIQVYRALLESMASEEAARMTAMENATKAAREMIDALTLKYNKARQATITGELMDIVGGVEALKKA